MYCKFIHKLFNMAPWKTDTCIRGTTMYKELKMKCKVHRDKLK